MGIFNMFIVIPMLIQVMSFRWIYLHLLDSNPGNAIRLAGVLLVCAAVAVLFVRTARVDTAGELAPRHAGH
jgi:maltose/moltooligosaccharide transporter